MFNFFFKKIQNQSLLCKTIIKGIYLISIIIFFLFVLSFLFFKIIYEIPIQFDYLNTELYIKFLEGGIEVFVDRYGYGFHILHTLLLGPFWLFQYSLDMLHFSFEGIQIERISDLNTIIRYSGKGVSLLCFTLLLLYTYRLTYFFTRNGYIAILPLVMISGDMHILDHASSFRVDIPLLTFLIASFYYLCRYYKSALTREITLFVILSIFAISIKYQALMFLAPLYVFTFIFLCIKKRWLDIVFGIAVLIIGVYLFHANHYGVRLALEMRIDLNSDFLSLTMDEQRWKSFTTLDRIKEISINMYDDWGKNSYLTLLLFLLLPIFYKKIKNIYFWLFSVPIICSLFLHLYVVTIFNHRHYMLYVVFLSIATIIMTDKVLQKLGKSVHMKVLYYIIVSTLYIVTLVFSIGSIFDYNHYLHNDPIQKVSSELMSYIKNSDKILFVNYYNMPVPFGLQYTISGGAKKNTDIISDEDVKKYNFVLSFSKLDQENLEELHTFIFNSRSHYLYKSK